MNFEFDILDLNENLEVVTQGKKTVYNCDLKTELNDFVINKNRKSIDSPKFSSALTTKGIGKIGEGSFGTLAINGNNVAGNPSGVYIVNGDITRGLTKKFFTSQNFLFLSTVFTSRKIISSTWLNQKDEYLSPNENHELFRQFQHDSLVHCLFHIHSFQTSLREIQCEDFIFDIKNEFFWMSADSMKTQADNMGYDELYNDARTSPDRHVYKLLFGPENVYEKLSPDAKAVLDKATELVELSMEMRQVMANDENHLNSWDAGYAQLKLVWKEYFPEQFKEFRQFYKNMEDRMRPLVYELGFLMK